jgi:omega-hydroxy-beta-dihydromenaquinone-9 sulfotransferase
MKAKRVGSGQEPSIWETGEKPPSYPAWGVRFWHGMRFSTYIKLLASYSFRISPSRVPMSLLLSGIAVCNSCLAVVQLLVYRKRLQQTPTPRPLFVLGHWRSGTTLLHELMAKDPALNFPNTYQCFVPHHFLVSQRFLPYIVRFFLPSKRPMDAMDSGFDRPQEDEFALVALGAPTPYLRMAFPNEVSRGDSLLTLEKIANQAEQNFADALLGFTKSLSLSKPGRLVLKSPTHTGRAILLSRLFPGSQFVHVSRNPFHMIPSTIRLWKTLDYIQGFQVPRYSESELVELVMSTFERMYESYFRQRDELLELAPNHDSESDTCRFCEIRYEDLITAPVAVLRQVYADLGLRDFDQVEPGIESYFRDQKEYAPREYQIPNDLQQKIASRCQRYIDHFGYAIPASNSVAVRTRPQNAAHNSATA